MTRDDYEMSSRQAALSAELEQEVERLAEGARRENSVEAVMRLRALAEIAVRLDTDQLLAIAVWASNEQEAGARSNRLAS